MGIYVILSFYYLMSIIVESTFKLKLKKKNSEIWIFVLILPLFFIAAFREINVGNDTIIYYKSYEIISQEDFFGKTNSVFEIGYILLVKVISRLGFDYHAFQVIITFFIYYVFSTTIKKYSMSPAISILIFFSMNMFFDTMNITRTYLAISILFLSLKYIEERKPFKFSFYVIIASLFHTSALVFFTLYLFAQIKWSYKNLIEILTLAVIVTLFFDHIVSLFVSMTGRYSDYLSSQYFIFEDNIAVYISLLINTIFLILGLLTKLPQDDINFSQKNHINENKKIFDQKISSGLIERSNIWFAAMVITFVISVAGLNSTIMGRVGIYFSVLYIIFIPDILTKIREIKIRSLVAVIIILGLLLYFYVILLFRPNWYGVVPYNWFLYS
ncbi:hypothetical protein CD30_07100 [Ureibacillus massiliensis 4400831 = CIP 108448 = CCUG 49529]|uniref:EpsG family protein n=1 Tax=Ureibacillus massiliensis 4400831 = CIP 108448 = CCUG 49529 TaxID=1211035 RepID=A0A0A3J2F9_9BACL|nr:EpsG family protein [Ureibacillus massiliensis]KGR91204.1 hypothetical protein CD30_07100 [Ureibacillus massiliensis 4400831 = CIP 108448 = CCUG 49529]